MASDARRRLPLSMTVIRDRLDKRSFGLDVVRCLAILLVLLSHCGAFLASWFGLRFAWQLGVGGFYGVELFFVLSGFLIGRLLIELIHSDCTARGWLVFMTRRWMRTLPLYFAWLFLLSLVWPPHWWQAGHHDLWRILPWYLTLTQNLDWAMVDGWFGVSWSLTVEEWFYLLFSLALFAATVLAKPRTAILGCVALFIVGPTLLRWRLPESVNWDQVTQTGVFYRLDAIAFGAAVAWLSLFHQRSLRRPHSLFLVGTAIVAFVWLYSGTFAPRIGISNHFANTFIFSFAALGFALCLPLAARPAQAARTRMPLWFRAGVTALSRLSYSIYITHLSLLEYADVLKSRLRIPATISVIGAMLAIVGSSYVIYRFFEAPILALRPRQVRVTDVNAFGEHVVRLAGD